MHNLLKKNRMNNKKEEKNHFSRVVNDNYETKKI